MTVNTLGNILIVMAPFVGALTVLAWCVIVWRAGDKQIFDRNCKTMTKEVEEYLKKH